MEYRKGFSAVVSITNKINMNKNGRHYIWLIQDHIQDWALALGPRSDPGRHKCESGYVSFVLCGVLKQPILYCILKIGEFLQKECLLLHIPEPPRIPCAVNSETTAYRCALLWNIHKRHLLTPQENESRGWLPEENTNSCWWFKLLHWAHISYTRGLYLLVWKKSLSSIGHESRNTTLGIAMTKIPMAENSDQLLHFVDFYLIICEAELITCVISLHMLTRWTSSLLSNLFGNGHFTDFTADKMIYWLNEWIIDILTAYGHWISRSWLLIPWRRDDLWPQLACNIIRKFSASPPHFNPYPSAFPYGNGMVLHFYQQQESSTTKTVHRVINKGLKAYV